MKRQYDAVDHPELDRLIAQLGPDLERDRLAGASIAANTHRAELGAELETLTARAAEVAARIGAGVADQGERVRLAKTLASAETEGLFAPGRLEAATLACGRAELAYLAHVYRAAVLAERAVQEDDLAAHRAWAGPAVRAEELAQTTYPQHDVRRAELAAELVPLAVSRGATARRVAALQELRSLLRVFVEARYGPGLDLANPRTFEGPVRGYAGRVVTRWRAAHAA